MVINMNKRFPMLLFFYYSQYCILFSFSAVFFQEQGYSEGQIGRLAAVSGLVVILAGPSAGRLADWYGEKKVVVASLMLTVLCAALLYGQRRSFLPILLLYAMVSVVDKTAGPLLDNWVFQSSLSNGKINYGAVRAAGSFGSALCAAGTGILIAKAGFGAVFLLHGVLTAGACVLAVSVPQVKREQRDFRPADKAGGDSWIQLLHNRKYMLLLLVSALLFLGVTTEVTFYPVLFLQCGGSTGLLGISLFVMSVSELCGMACYRKLRSRFTAGELLMASVFFYTGKLFCQIWMHQVTGLILIQLLQGVTYGLFLPAVVSLVNEYVPRRLSATGMSLCAVCFNGVGVVLGNWAAGGISERFGLRWAYVTGAVFCGVAGILCAAGIWQPWRNNRPKGKNAGTMRG